MYSNVWHQNDWNMIWILVSFWRRPSRHFLVSCFDLETSTTSAFTTSSWTPQNPKALLCVGVFNMDFQVFMCVEYRFAGVCMCVCSSFVFLLVWRVIIIIHKIRRIIIWVLRLGGFQWKIKSDANTENYRSKYFKIYKNNTNRICESWF